MLAYEAVIGLEVHVQLATATKIFCRCPNRFGAEPNTLVCPVCLGYPGTLPVLNRRVVDLAVKLALALGCDIHPTSIFARKNYFYADLPKGYQISQFDRPLAERGSLPLTLHPKRVRVHRLHLEEDAGKLLHEAPGGAALENISYVDFNRCGVPLVEIVSEPDMRSAAEAEDYLRTLHQLLLYTGTSDGNMEEGSLRCDANVSIRPAGESRFGTKTEIKNVNSFKNVARAIDSEIARQTELVASAEAVVQETRGFDAATGATRSLRSKEQAHDYRYFPEPDLPPLVLVAERIDTVRRALPELPWDRRARFVESYGLSETDARDLASTPELAAYFEACAAACPENPRAMANWVRNEVLREVKERKLEISAAIEPERIAGLQKLVDDGALSVSAAKQVLGEIWTSGETAEAATGRLGLLQVRDTSQIEVWIGEVLAENPAQLAQYRSGKTQLLGFFVGQVMKRSGGRAEPKQVQERLREALGSEVPAPS